MFSRPELILASIYAPGALSPASILSSSTVCWPYLIPSSIQVTLPPSALLDKVTAFLGGWSTLSSQQGMQVDQLLSCDSFPSVKLCSSFTLLVSPRQFICFLSNNSNVNHVSLSAKLLFCTTPTSISYSSQVISITTPIPLRYYM